jgi:hypothetical protein
MSTLKTTIQTNETDLISSLDITNKCPDEWTDGWTRSHSAMCWTPDDHTDDEYMNDNTDKQNNEINKSLYGYIPIYTCNDRYFARFPIQNITYEYFVGKIYEVPCNTLPLSKNNSFSLYMNLKSLDTFCSNKPSLYIMVESLGKISIETLDNICTKIYTDKIKVLSVLSRNQILS